MKRYAIYEKDERVRVEPETYYPSRAAAEKQIPRIESAFPVFTGKLVVRAV